MSLIRNLRIGHRTRLTAIATATCGLILFVALRVAMVGFNRTELSAAGEVLIPELNQAVGELKENPASPDLQEITAADPSVSVAVFSLTGRLVHSAGKLSMRPIVGFGKTGFGGVKAVYQGVRTPLGIVTVASPWGNRDAMVDRVNGLGLLLCFGSTLCVAIVTWLASNAAFTPLDRLAKEAERLSGNNLSGRLSVADRGEYASFIQTLNRFLDRIESSVRREERFVSDAAHELRTPLTILRGRIETTLARTRTTGEYREALATVLDETERLSRLVELLLQSGANASEPVEPVDLEQEVERVHARWVDRFHARGVRLEFASQPAYASILPSEFDVIVDNLLANALNASPEGTQCWLQSEAVHNVARIEVRDQGMGIPPESRELIFERLTRLDSGRNRNVGGFGIGLAVCRRLVESRGGTIYIAPSDEGALFVVELPLKS